MSLLGSKNLIMYDNYVWRLNYDTNYVNRKRVIIRGCLTHTCSRKSGNIMKYLKDKSPFSNLSQYRDRHCLSRNSFCFLIQERSKWKKQNPSQWFIPSVAQSGADTRVSPLFPTRCSTFGCHRTRVSLNAHRFILTEGTRESSHGFRETRMWS